MVARGVVGTVDTHFGTLLAVVTRRANCENKFTLGEWRLPAAGLSLVVSKDDAHFDRSRPPCVRAGSRTLPSHGGRGRTGCRRGTTGHTAHRKSPLGILGLTRREKKRKTLEFFRFFPTFVQLGGRAGRLTVLTGHPPVAWPTHTRPCLSLAGVTVGTVLETGLVAVAPPQAIRAGFTAVRAFK